MTSTLDSYDLNSSSIRAHPYDGNYVMQYNKLQSAVADEIYIAFVFVVDMLL